VLRNYPITPPRAPANIRDASHPQDQFVPDPILAEYS
jgi:hypothetical protein